MKKVLILGPLPPPYMGPSIATEIVLQSKLKDSFKLIHLDNSTHETIKTLGVWSWKRFLKNVGHYLKMFYLLARYWPQIVLIPISQTTIGFLKDSIFIIISRMFRRKTILQLRGGNFKNWLSGSSRLTIRYVSFILRRSQGMIVLGNKLKKLFEDYYSSENIFVVPNGANICVPVVKSNQPIMKLLYLSNLQPSKGIEDVLGAVAICNERNQGIVIELDVVGSWWDDETQERCQRIVKLSGSTVFFHPPAIGKIKIEYLARADVFVFPPWEPEGHPWVIIEAMAAGLPIISTDQGAITESVIDGYNGFIVEKHSPRQIAEKVLLFANDNALRERMGRNSRKQYEEKYTEDKMVEKLTWVFNFVIKN